MQTLRTQMEVHYLAPPPPQYYTICAVPVLAIYLALPTMCWLQQLRADLREEMNRKLREELTGSQVLSHEGEGEVRKFLILNLNVEKYNGALWAHACTV